MTEKTDKNLKNNHVLKRDLKKTENRDDNILHHMRHRKKYNRFLRILGPGLISGAADNDPSGTITYSQAGAGFGLGFLWAFPFMYPLLLAVQESSSRIGAVTGKGLASIIKQNYSKKVLFLCVGFVVIANIINIGADLGAMASTTQLFIDLPFELLVIIYSTVILSLVLLVRYKKYVKILKWLAVALLAYPVTAILIGQDWVELIRNTFFVIPTINASTIYILVGLLGTTISPYLFFWDTSETVEEEVAHHRLCQNHDNKDPKISKNYLKNIRFDNFMGMTLASITAWFIVVTCASVLFENGIHEIGSAAEAAKALEPLVQGFPYAGLIAKLIFSVGIVGIGLLAVPVLAGSSAYAISETFGWKEGLYRKLRQATGFYLVIIIATLVGMIINFLGIDPIQALIFTAVFNGIAAVPLILMIIRIGNNRKIMGEYRNGWLSNIFVNAAFIVMFLAVIALFYYMYLGQFN